MKNQLSSQSQVGTPGTKMETPASASVREFSLSATNKKTKKKRISNIEEEYSDESEDPVWADVDVDRKIIDKEDYKLDQGRTYTG